MIKLWKMQREVIRGLKGEKEWLQEYKRGVTGAEFAWRTAQKAKPSRANIFTFATLKSTINSSFIFLNNPDNLRPTNFWHVSNLHI